MPDNTIQLQVTDTHIQWKPSVDAEWIDLIALNKLIPAELSSEVIRSSPGDDFLARIDVLGEQNILGFAFDNSGRKIFFANDERFSVATHYNAELESLVFEEEDTRGQKYTVIKPVDMIQTIYTAKPELIGKIHPRDING